MKEQLIDLEMYIEAYNDTAPNDGHALNEILKKNCGYFMLFRKTTYRI